MTVGDLLKALADVPPDLVITVAGCEKGRCTSSILSVEIESRRTGNEQSPVAVTLTRWRR